MAPKSEILTREEFASLLKVGTTSAVFDPPAVISAEHSTRLIGLGYMMDLAGRLRLTTPGRLRMRAENQPRIRSNKNVQHATALDIPRWCSQCERSAKSILRRARNAVARDG
jgi:hypothetical protein